MAMLVAPHFRSQLAQLKKSRSHAVILTGDKGMGLLSLAKDIAGSTLIKVVAPNDKATITIEQIRALYKHARGVSTKDQTIIIDEAELMSHSAQNALLKLLEEPSGRVSFILTSYQSAQLLPTIVSRTQRFHVPLLSDAQSRKIIDHYKQLSDVEKQQLVFIAGGRPELLRELAENTAKRQRMIATMTSARSFTQARTTFDRLAIVTPLMKSRIDATEFIDACVLIYRQLAHSANTPQRTIDQLALLVDIHRRISQNASLRLQLLRLVV